MIVGFVPWCLSFFIVLRARARVAWRRNSKLDADKQPFTEKNYYEYTTRTRNDDYWRRFARLGLLTKYPTNQQAAYLSA
eukprot:scaffold2657_cov89-Amphora_coffeaeformis.AAC.28